MSGLTIPFEIADGIALTVMQEHLDLIKEEIREHTEEGRWMHPEDYHANMTQYIPSLEILIKYFGGNVGE
jgi:hypothetical protein